MFEPGHDGSRAASPARSCFSSVSACTWRIATIDGAVSQSPCADRRRSRGHIHRHRCRDAGCVHLLRHTALDRACERRSASPSCDCPGGRPRRPGSSCWCPGHCCAPRCSTGRRGGGRGYRDHPGVERLCSRLPVFRNGAPGNCGCAACRFAGWLVRPGDAKARPARSALAALHWAAQPRLLPAAPAGDDRNCSLQCSRLSRAYLTNGVNVATLSYSRVPLR